MPDLGVAAASSSLQYSGPAPVPEKLRDDYRRHVSRPLTPRAFWRSAGAVIRGLRLLVLVGLVAAVVTTGVLRLFLLPNVDRYRGEIASAATEVLGRRVTLGPITGGWTGMRPWLSVRDVTVFDDQDRRALVLERVHLVMGWSSLLALELRTRALAVDHPDLVVRRDRSGHLFVAGIPMDVQGERGRFSAWLLAQRRIVVSDARVTWVDELRGARPLDLRDVSFELGNRGRRHRFRLEARPGFDVGTAVDVRGDFLTGRSRAPATWRGRLYVRAPYLNLGAVREWADLPLTFESGAGEVEGWLDFAAGRADRLVLDLRVAGTVARFDDGLPPLDVPECQGRLTWLRTEDGYEASARRLSIGVGGGAYLPPADVVIRRRLASGATPARLQIESDQLDLAPIAYIVNRLPVDARVRRFFDAHRPVGHLSGMSFSLETPVTGAWKYSGHARFSGLGVLPVGIVPGGRNLSGSLAFDQSGGQIHLDGSNVSLNFPKIFVAPITLDTIAARVDWKVDGGNVAVTLRSATGANADASGSAHGTFEFRQDGARIVDLSAAFQRASAAAVWKYVPKVVGDRTRQWLRSALLDGVARNGRVRLKGDLRKFPFDDGSGEFEIGANVSGGRLRFEPDWPEIEQVSADLRFSRREMRIDAQGTILGARVESATVRIPDLGAANPVLEVDGRARGPTAAFARYLDASPVGEMVGSVSRGAVVAGDGSLHLALAIPLDAPHQTRVSGEFVFANDRIESFLGLPPLENVRATLQFTEKGARVRNGALDIFGTPTRFNVSTRGGDVVNVDARGVADVARVRDRLGVRFLDPWSGRAAWRARATVRGGRLQLTADSDLKGVAIALPAPLGKKADEGVPTRVQVQTRQGDLWVALVAAERASAVAIVSRTADRWRVERGAVDFGGAARLPEEDRLVIRGDFPRVDLDQWIAAAGLIPAEESTAPGGLIPITTDLSIGTLELYGREFHDVSIGLRRKADLWSAIVSSDEVEGAFDWLPSGRGTVSAHLSRLRLPDARAGTESGEVVGGEDLPRLSIAADDFRIGSMDLGHLTLDAEPDGSNWLIKKLDVNNPDFHLTAQGGWEMKSGTSRTQLAVRLDASDIGKALQRLNRPRGVTGGTARVAGMIEWDGTPQRIDLATLSGRLSVEARDGQFAQLDPGIAKLFGILSLQALPKRVALDFRDIFSRGFAFDEITANTVISSGMMRTDDFRMTGASARVTMKGTIDIPHETQDLDVRVIPSVSESLAVGTAFVNPLAGFLAYILGKAFDNPLDRAVSFDYRISGTWADPVVKPKRGGEAGPVPPRR
ncbi:MAG: TIGR02099 family protein [Betaproteobacteria bacterium]|nr:TIGR02099 family protein [Betaproteobacteria bacterium]